MVTASAKSYQGIISFDLGGITSRQQITLTASALEGYEFVRWIEKTWVSTYE